MTDFYYPNPFDVKINMSTGELDMADNAYNRHLSQMAAMYEDQEAVRKLLEVDPVIYKVYEKQLPQLPGELQWCMSVTLPGMVGREYYMTKGHYHAVRETAEIYLCVGGEGYLLMETEQGEVDYREMRPNTCVYVPAYWAHRSINSINPSAGFRLQKTPRLTCGSIRTAIFRHGMWSIITAKMIWLEFFPNTVKKDFPKELPRKLWRCEGSKR